MDNKTSNTFVNFASLMGISVLIFGLLLLVNIDIAKLTTIFLENSMKKEGGISLLAFNLIYFLSLFPGVILILISTKHIKNAFFQVRESNEITKESKKNIKVILIVSVISVFIVKFMIYYLDRFWI